MTDNTELRRLIRLSRLGRQIAARLPADLDHELHGHLRELPAKSTETRNQADIEQGGASSAAGGGAREPPRSSYNLPTGGPAGARSRR